LIEKYGEQCSQCGWACRHAKTGRVPIQVDHVDGDPYNHRPENLRLLCPNCHSLTDTYGGLNSGRGRKERGVKRAVLAFKAQEEERLLGMQEVAGAMPVEGSG
jgi:5-methylcytosine-specific restriction endonuclease McrA